MKKQWHALKEAVVGAKRKDKVVVCAERNFLYFINYFLNWATEIILINFTLS